MGCNLRDLASPSAIEMRDLAGERIAVDAFLTAYQFITSLRARGDGSSAHAGRMHTRDIILPSAQNY